MNAMNPTKLIVLRGPSGAGKTTVAKQLFQVTARPTVLLEQDYYRFSFKPPGGHKTSTK
jgi:uridine kinase